MEKRQRNLFYWLLPLVCFFGNLSQLPAYSGASQIIFKIGWVLMLGLAFLLQNKNLYLDRHLFYLAVLLDGMLFVLSRVTGRGYLSTALFSNLNLCVFVAAVAYMIGLGCEEDILYPVSLAYVLSAMICGVWVYYRYYYGVDWLRTSAYLYGAKNSFATILLCALVLCYFWGFARFRALALGATGVCLLLLIVLKSRATLVSASAFVFYLLIIRPQKVSSKLIGLSVCVGAAALVLLHPGLRVVIIENILLNNKNAADITAVTSNRDQFLRSFVQYFPKHWLIGWGSGFLECFPLSVLYTVGVLGAIPVFKLVCYPVRVARAYGDIAPESVMPEVLLVLTALLWINGLFEEQPPFGPGVKCSLIWLMAGLLAGIAHRRKEELLWQE